MYEVVKTVNGHDIFRMVGSRGFYRVKVRDFGNGNYTERTFRTIKAAAAFCETF